VYEKLSCLWALGQRQIRMGLQPHIIASRDTLTADTLTLTSCRAEFHWPPTGSSTGRFFAPAVCVLG